MGFLAAKPPYLPSLSSVLVKQDPSLPPRVLSGSGSIWHRVIATRGADWMLMVLTVAHINAARTGALGMVPSTSRASPPLTFRCLDEVAIIGISVLQVVEAGAQRSEATCLESHSRAGHQQPRLVRHPRTCMRRLPARTPPASTLRVALSRCREALGQHGASVARALRGRSDLFIVLLGRL